MRSEGKYYRGTPSFNAKKDFYAISITELTNLAGVSRISFYRNFESKEDVLIKHMHERSIATFANLNATNVRERLIGLFKVTDELGDILDLLYSQNLSHLFLQYFACTIGAKPEQTNREAFQNSMMMGICFGALDEWVKEVETKALNKWLSYYNKWSDVV
ncbi:TetR family transcriptional regulator [Actinobacillus equuli]|nr:TetR family transcriptional regulator [Actinobacillus equuli]